ncbi:adenosine 3'-phospho 5'-phosphosulfate transporter 1 [Cladochytrium replicatum]|nr:adenosine 3'-phospho 5'-phosphosulfate transporter 1 [Cladochytrium replicatum]
MSEMGARLTACCPGGSLRSSRLLRLIFVASSMISLFVGYGVMQERIMTKPYGESGEKFQDTALLVLINRIVSVIVAVIMLAKKSIIDILFSGPGSLPASNMRSLWLPVAPILSYFAIAGSNFASTFSQYEALKYVSFPTQTLGKCAKMIPVMIIGATGCCVGGRKVKYSTKDYFAALAITAGCTLFLTCGNSSSGSDRSDTIIGLILMSTYLFFDGFTSTAQERLFKGYEMTTYNQMLYISLCSMIISVGLLLVPLDLFLSKGYLPPNKIPGAIAFAAKYPDVIWDALTLSFCSSLGQMMIYICIKEFGALVFSTIMTTRQFISVFLSAMIFAHPLTPIQWIGAIVVFAALYYKGSQAKSTTGKGGSPRVKRANDGTIKELDFESAEKDLSSKHLKDPIAKPVELIAVAVVPSDDKCP